MGWFRLAETLGRSLGETQETVDSREFAEWMAYWRWQEGPREPEPYKPSVYMRDPEALDRLMGV